MPATALRTTVKEFLEEQGRTLGRFAVKSEEAQSLIAIVAITYVVSREAARVRLLQQGTLSEGDLPAVLF